jgi:hypothetical protein
MSHRPFRFVHAADLHLEEPLSGVADPPEHLRDLFLDAGYAAAQRVFEIALAEEAELLILAGDVLQPYKTGPRGPLFLLQQFERLREHGIAVYWAGGRVDPPEAWPTYLKLPDNVHVFPAGAPQDFTQNRQGVPLIRITGASRVRGRPIRAGEFMPDPAGLYSIAVIHGNVNPETVKARGIDYWALGGSHTRATPLTGLRTAHHPGTPQGRSPQQCGPHGCTLVHVDDQRRTRVNFVPADVVRWQNERIALDRAATPENLRTRLFDRMQTLKEAHPGTDLLVSWTIAGDGPTMTQLRRGTLATELLAALREEHGRTSPAAWSLSLVAEAPASLPHEWYEQDTIRGDYLRELQRYQDEAELPLSMEPYLAEGHPAALGDKTQISDAERDDVLREAAMLGVDLLSGEESPP